jgi:hypothetical protein
MKDAIASLLCRGQHCLDIPSQEQHAPEFFCLHTLSVVLIVVVIAGSTRGWCAQFAERIITIGSQHTNINICAQVEVIARHTSSGSPRAEKEVIVFGETGIIHCAGIGIIAGCEQNDSDLTQSKYSHSCASIDTKSVTLNIDVTPVNRMTVT